MTITNDKDQNNREEIRMGKIFWVWVTTLIGIFACACLVLAYSIFTQKEPAWHIFLLFPSMLISAVFICIYGMNNRTPAILIDSKALQSNITAKD